MSVNDNVNDIDSSAAGVVEKVCDFSTTSNTTFTTATAATASNDNSSSDSSIISSSTNNSTSSSNNNNSSSDTLLIVEAAVETDLLINTVKEADRIVTEIGTAKETMTDTTALATHSSAKAVVSSSSSGRNSLRAATPSRSLLFAGNQHQQQQQHHQQQLLQVQQESLFDLLASLVVQGSLSLEEVVNIAHSFGIQHGEKLREKVNCGADVAPAPAVVDISISCPAPKKNKSRAPRTSRAPLVKDPLIPDLSASQLVPLSDPLSLSTLSLPAAMPQLPSIASQESFDIAPSMSHDDALQSDSEMEFESLDASSSMLYLSDEIKSKGVEIVEDVEARGFPGRRHYRSFVTLGGSVIGLGLFPSEESAAHVHDRTIIRLFGPAKCLADRSLLNFPVESYSTDPLDAFTCYDKILRKTMFGTAWTGFKDIDFSSLMTKNVHSQSSSKKRPTKDNPVDGEEQPARSKKQKKLFIGSQKFQQFALFVSGEKEKYKNTPDDGKHVFLVDRISVGGWCQVLIPDKKDPLKISFLRADVVEKFDMNNLRSQLILLNPIDLTPSDLVFEQIVIQFLIISGLVPPDTTAASLRAEIAPHFYPEEGDGDYVPPVATEVDQGESCDISTSSLSVPPNIEATDLIEEVTAPVEMLEEPSSTNENDLSPTSTNSILSCILEGSMSRDDVNNLSETVLANIVKALMDNSNRDARSELLMDTLVELFTPENITRHNDEVLISDCDALKSCLWNYIVELDF